MATSSDNVAGVAATAAVAIVLAAVPPFLGGTRELEIVAARALLGAELPDHDRKRPLDRETRVRTALWFALHLAGGAAIGTLLLIAVPLAMLAFTERLGLTHGALAGLDIGPMGAGDRWAWTAAGFGLLAGSLYATAGLGAIAAGLAPVLLGPSPAEREDRLAARERQLAERNRLARELHDSVGHALTAATMQAGAARAVFDRDPEFARRALGSIEELGRTALDELDAVLGVLRETEADRHTQPTLADLGRLLTDGIDAEVTAPGVTAAELPAHVSREAYRIVQESLTNATKHGGGAVRLRISTDDDDLRIEVVNRLAEVSRGPGGRGGGGGGGGHGLAGMRERVRLLGGELAAGPDGDGWRVSARLPRRPS